MGSRPASSSVFGRKRIGLWGNAFYFFASVGSMARHWNESVKNGVTLSLRAEHTCSLATISRIDVLFESAKTNRSVEPALPMYLRSLIVVNCFGGAVFTANALSVVERNCGVLDVSRCAVHVAFIPET